MNRRTVVRYWAPPVAAIALLALPAVVSLAGPQRAKAQYPVRFKDSVVPRPPGYPANRPWPVFRMSQDYPASLSLDDVSGPWDWIDFRDEPRRYLAEVLRYGIHDNLAIGSGRHHLSRRRWFHAPYLHSLPHGREPLRGLTYERVTTAVELIGEQNARQKKIPPDRRFQNWAVALYNAPGGWVLGRFWEGGTPHPGVVEFPLGTVAFKLLFTEATPQEVPYLWGAPTWEAYIYERALPSGGGSTPKRVRKTLYLLQVDVAVRDRNADARNNGGQGAGWVFCTYRYNAFAPGPGPDQTEPDWLTRLRPLGLMWGNDLSQNHLIPDPSMEERGYPNHRGAGGRLNGPVDNPKSSCLSCHSTAETPFNERYVPEGTNTKRWFRTLPTGTPFTKCATSLHYSLQLAHGMRNYRKENPD